MLTGYICYHKLCYYSILNQICFSFSPNIYFRCHSTKKSSMSSDSNQENEESAESPGVFMKATIKSMKLKFPSVKNIVTSILAQWLKPESERHVILLVNFQSFIIYNNYQSLMNSKSIGHRLYHTIHSMLCYS